jgi:hypothetical protein
MSVPKEIENAKKAYDNAWAEATKYGDEALEALRMADLVQARDAHELFVQKAKRAMIAYQNWTSAASLAAKVMDEYYSKARGL